MRSLPSMVSRGFNQSIFTVSVTKVSTRILQRLHTTTSLPFSQFECRKACFPTAIPTTWTLSHGNMRVQTGHGMMRKPRWNLGCGYVTCFDAIGSCFSRPTVHLRSANLHRLLLHSDTYDLAASLNYRKPARARCQTVNTSPALGFRQTWNIGWML